MAVAVVALTIALVGAAGTAVVLGLRAAGLREERQAAEFEAERQIALAKHWQQASSDRDDALAKRDLLIAELRGEIAVLEGDLDACQDPAVVRDRLRRMLQVGAAAGERAASGPAPLPPPPGPGDPAGGAGRA